MCGALKDMKIWITGANDGVNWSSQEEVGRTAIIFEIPLEGRKILTVCKGIKHVLVHIFAHISELIILNNMDILKKGRKWYKGNRVWEEDVMV